MKYLRITDELLEAHPHLVRLIWPTTEGFEGNPGASHLIPLDHPNSGMISCYGAEIVDLPTNFSLADRVAHTVLTPVAK